MTIDIQSNILYLVRDKKQKVQKLRKPIEGNEIRMEGAYSL